MTRNTKSMVVAREAIIINVGGQPAEYRRIQVRDRRTGDLVEILDTDNDPVVAEDPGTPYAFKANEIVSKNHPAVKANPGAFIPADEADLVEA